MKRVAGKEHVLIEHPIRARNAALTDVSLPGDFELGEGQAVPLSRLQDSEVSPYCLDPASRQVICVAGADIRGATFLYQVQRAQARSVIRVPIDCLPEAPLSPVLLFSIGRCGSTLLQKGLEVLGVTTVGEPDFFTQATLPEVRAVMNANGVRQAVGGATALLPGEVIKLRAECCNASLLLAGAFLRPRVVFILRDPLDWAASVSRAWEHARPLQEIANSLHYSLLSLDRLIQCHDVAIIYYEDFRGLDVGFMQALLDWLGYDVAIDAPALQAVAAADSQEGTWISRSNMQQAGLPDGFRQAFANVWARTRPEEIIRRHGLKM